MLLRKVGARGLMTSEPPFGYLTKFQFGWNKPEQLSRKESPVESTEKPFDGMTNLQCTGIPVA